MKELFNPKFVHFMWDDSLEGKEGFFADDVCDLKDIVNYNSVFINQCIKSESCYAPFQSSADEMGYRFFYHDPNYKVKRAFKEGKVIEYRDKSTCNQWETCSNPMWLENAEYRVKPEETVDLSSYLKPKKWVKFNLNHHIEVKLNEEGERIYAEHFAKTALHLDSMKNPDENGYRSFQMHEFMEIFGNHFGPSAQDIPCDMDVLLEVEVEEDEE